MSLTLISAPAGSGKTTSLVQRYLEFIRDGLLVERIVAITFTRRAAAELVERIRSVLDHAAGGPRLAEREAQLYAKFLPSEAQALAALRALASAPVSTVDSFVIALLQRFQLDAAVPLGGDARAWIDGALALDPAPKGRFELAAREEIDRPSDDAKLLLAHASVSDVVAAIAKLAEEPYLRRASATAFLERTGAAFVDALGDHESKVASLVPDIVTKQGKLVDASVRGWIANSRAAAPDALFPWLRNFGADAPPWLTQSGDAAAKVAIAATDIALDASRCHEFTIGAGWRGGEASTTSDSLAKAAIALATSVRARALTASAAEGRLGYRELLLAATDLCTRRPVLVRATYDALLVDEVQDTSPEQLRLYQAIANAEVAKREPMRVVFVGDVRQSIYGFRDADPAGWSDLEAIPNVSKVTLEKNFRSHARLVAVQRTLVEGWNLPNGDAPSKTPGVEPLGDVTSGRDDAWDTDEGVAVFVWATTATDRLDDATVVRFAERLLARRAKLAARSPETVETAAVLTASWPKAMAAVLRLRSLGVQARVVGARELLESRVATDVRLWLRVLLDPSDTVALVGVLKHPTVGVSDAGLAALAKVGLGRALFAEESLAALARSDGNTAALTRVRETFGRAMADVGRVPTADVLERLVSAHHWRPVIHAGPEGDAGRAVAELDVLLDVVRQVEADGIDPARVLERLTPDRERQDDLPQVRVRGDAQVVEVTTVFQAKGLAWNHVAVLNLTKRGGRGETGIANTTRRRGQAWVTTRFDPAGAMTRVTEPLGAVLAEAAKNDETDERRRLLYVAITRARDSITVALPHTGYGPEVKPAIEKAALSGVELVEAATQTIPSIIATVRAATGAAHPLRAMWAAEPPAIVTTSPTSLERQLTKADREELRVRYGAACRLEKGPAVPTKAGLALLEGVEESVIGDVVHGWLDRWGFSGEPDPAVALAYLGDRWSVPPGAEGAALAQWVVALGLAVRDGIPELTRLLGERRRHEWPVLGMVDGRMVSGRADLVVERADGSLVVLDFKAGGSVPTAFQGNHGVSTSYVVQLEAYRRILEAAGKRVAEVGLIYVRGLTWVRFGLN